MSSLPSLPIRSPKMIARRLWALGLINQIDGAAQYATSLLGPAHKSNLFQLLRCALHFRVGSFATGSSRQRVQPCPLCRESGSKNRVSASAANDKLAANCLASTRLASIRLWPGVSECAP